MLYNPTTVKPYDLIMNIQDVTDDSFAEFHRKRAKESREAAIEQGVHGHVYWLEGDKIYRAYVVPAAFWNPLTMEGLEVPGINWGTKYFLTKEAAEAFRKARLDAGFYQTDTPRYSEEGDVWSVHYHYEYGNW